MSFVTPVLPRVDVVHLRNELASGAGSVAGTAGAWTNCPVNTKAIDTGAICTLASNQFTLPAGTYQIDAEQTFVTAGRAATRLRNVTDAANTIVGQTISTVLGTEIGCNCPLYGQFTITASKTFALQYYVETGSSGQELGRNFVATGLPTGYCDIFIRKVA